MSSPGDSSLREAGKLYLLYVAAGAAAIPAGVVYSLLHIARMERWWTASPILGVGLSMALYAWRYYERRFYLPRKGPELPLSQDVGPMVRLTRVLGAPGPAQIPMVVSLWSSSIQVANYQVALEESILAALSQHGKEEASGTNREILLFQYGNAGQIERLRDMLAGNRQPRWTVPQKAPITQQTEGGPPNAALCGTTR